MTKLKPCPLCGKPVTMKKYLNVAYWIQHDESDMCGIVFELGSGYTAKGAKHRNALIKAWNARPEPAGNKAPCKHHQKGKHCYSPLWCHWPKQKCRQKPCLLIRMDQ